MEWAAVMRSALCSSAVLDSLEKWANSKAAALDDFYEGCTVASASANLARRALLVQAMRAASVLSFVQDEILGAACGPPETGDDASALWTAAGLPRALNEIVSTLASLELEGFNVAVSPQDLPGHVPASHRWWKARPPLHASGRLHYC